MGSGVDEAFTGGTLGASTAAICRAAGMTAVFIAAVAGADGIKFFIGQKSEINNAARPSSATSSYKMRFAFMDER